MQKLTHKLSKEELLALYEVFQDTPPNAEVEFFIMFQHVQLQILQKLKKKLIEEKRHYKLQLTVPEAVVFNFKIGRYTLTQNLWLNNVLANLYANTDKFLSQFKTQLNTIKSIDAAHDH